MITFIYWLAFFAFAGGCLFFIGYKAEEWKYAFISFFGVLIIGFLAYDFHFQQIFVKRYGGVMTIKTPEGEQHISATWKDDNLWIENYEPKTNRCHFREYSRGNLLQGQVTIKNCNPLLRTDTHIISPQKN